MSLNKFILVLIGCWLLIDGDFAFARRHRGRDHVGGPGTRPVAKAEPTTNAQISKEELALNQAIREVVTSHNRQISGKYTPQLCQLARRHNAYMAQTGRFHHSHFGYAENIAMHSGYGSLEKDAKGCAVQWWNSPGHRNNMLGRHQNFCHALTYSQNGDVYCTSIFGNGLPGVDENELVNTQNPQPSQQPVTQTSDQPVAGFDKLLLRNNAVGQSLLFGQNSAGQFVPLHINGQTGDLYGGIHASDTVSPETKKQLFDYYTKNYHAFGNSPPEIRNLVDRFISNVSTQMANPQPTTQPVPQTGGYEGVACWKLPKTHNYDTSRYGISGANVLNHAKRLDNESDPITMVHETTHYLNSEIRNSPDVVRKYRQANGFFLGDDCAVVLEGPNMRKSAIAAHVPGSLRNSRFNLYVAGSSAWDDTPLYLLDEFTAYLQGSRAGVEIHKMGRWNQGGRDGVAGAMEFIPYGIATAMAIAAKDFDYFRREPQFLPVIRKLIEESAKVFLEGHNLPSFQGFGQDRILENLRSSPDAENMRQWTRAAFGAEWAQRVLGF